MNRFLVTGGAGFIGSNIVDRLLKEGNFVRVLDNFSSGKMENLASAVKHKNFELIKGDIRNYSTCLKAARGVKYVLHQAALRSVPKSMNNPYVYNDVNINGTLNLLKASCENKIKRFVFASSSSIYGETDVFPEKETFVPELISPYALTKLAGEYYCRIFSTHYKLETVSLRYFNVYGPRQSLEDEYAVVVPKFIACMLKGEQPPIHGTGKQSRDFTYIDNVVDANILAAMKKGIKCTVLNIANSKDHTVLELVRILNEIMSKDIKPRFTPIRTGDVLRTYADISKAGKTIGYRPKVNFEAGLRLTVEWFESHL